MEQELETLSWQERIQTQVENMDARIAHIEGFLAASSNNMFVPLDKMISDAQIEFANTQPMDLETALGITQNEKD